MAGMSISGTQIIASGGKRLYTAVFANELGPPTMGTSQCVREGGVPFATWSGAGMNSMMECGSGMMWGMALFGVLGVVVLILLLAALIKYLFFARGR